MPDWKIKPEEARVLHQQHRAGVTVIALSQSTGYTRDAITNRWRNLGLPWRSYSEAQLLKNSRMSSAARLAQVNLAHQARRGQKVPHDELCRRAKAREGKALSGYEQLLADELKRAGLNPILGMAVGKYNVDLGLPNLGIAIEVDGGEWHSVPPKKAADQRRQSEIEKLGFRVFRIKGDRYLKKRATRLLKELQSECGLRPVPDADPQSG